MSEWYEALTTSDKEIVRGIVTEAVDSALFGVLTVLDGVRAFADPASMDKLRLVSVNPTGENLLNDPNSEFLHDLYQVATGKVD